MTEQQFYKIFNASPNALTVNDPGDLGYIYVNDSFLKITGYRREEIIGRKPEDLNLSLKTGDRGDLRRLLLETHSVSNVEAIIQTKSGQKRQCLISAETVDLNGKQCVIISINDIADLRRAEEQIRFHTNVLEQINDAVIAIDNHRRITYWNKSAEQMFEQKSEEVLGRKLEKVLHYRWIKPDGGHAANKSLAETDSWRGVNIFVKINGDEIYVESSVCVIRDENGTAIGQLAVKRDITRRMQIESELRKSEERFRTSVENMLDCFGIYSAVRDKSGRIVDFLVEYVNAAACANNMMTREEQIGKGLLEILPAHRQTGLFNQYCRVVETGLPLIKESMLYEDFYGGHRLARAFDIRVVKLGDGIAVAWRDITARKRAEDEMRALLLVDELTGLYNRRGFLTLSQHQLKIARRMNREMLLMFADVDGLKQINDTFGHLEGDRALIDTASILKESFRDPDIIARIGGDEFSVLVIEASREHIEAISTRFRDNLKAHNEKIKRPYKLSVSIGVAHYDPDQPCLINELLEQADKSMYDQKRLGQKRI